MAITDNHQETLHVIDSITGEPFPVEGDSATGAMKVTGIDGIGDVDGPASATDNAIARFDGTTGKIIQNSGVTVTDLDGLELPSTTGAAAGGITLGSDTNIYRSAADQLRTDDKFLASGTFNSGTMVRGTNAGTGNDTYGVYGELTGAVNSNFSGSVVGVVGSGVTQAHAIYAIHSGTNGNAFRTWISSGGGVQGLNVLHDHASATGSSAQFVHAGTPTNGVLYIRHTGTGRDINIDHDGTSAGVLTGIVVDVDNASTGGAIGIDVAASTATGNNTIGVRIAAPSGGSNVYALQLSDTGGTAAGGIHWATDTNLYRSAANTLKTDDNLLVTLKLEIDGDLDHDGSNIGFFGVAPTTRQTELTDELTTVTFTAPGTPDYAIQDLTNAGGFGFVTKDEGNTVLSVIANLQTRVNELETKLTAYGLLQDAD